jgi:hypothetical protein
VKLTEHGQRDLFEKAKAHFETLWCDREFEPYDASNQDHRLALAKALKREAGAEGLPDFTFFELRPKQYQQAMLDALAAERAHHRTRNLVVAATGTGKTGWPRSTTAPAASSRIGRKTGPASCLRPPGGNSPPELHTFRMVLRDQSFGDLCIGSSAPASTITCSHHPKSEVAEPADFGCSDFWDMVIVDECHHLAADSFQELLTTVRPQVLLGLTATRAWRWHSHLPFFQNRLDGSPAVELRLWHALDLQLLTPFDYFACDDPTDFAGVAWQKRAKGHVGSAPHRNNARAQSSSTSGNASPETHDKGAPWPSAFPSNMRSSWRPVSTKPAFPPSVFQAHRIRNAVAALPDVSLGARSTSSPLAISITRAWISRPSTPCCCSARHKARSFSSSRSAADFGSVKKPGKRPA